MVIKEDSEQVKVITDLARSIEAICSEMTVKSLRVKSEYDKLAMTAWINHVNSRIKRILSMSSTTISYSSYVSARIINKSATKQDGIELKRRIDMIKEEAGKVKPVKVNKEGQ